MGREWQLPDRFSDSILHMGIKKKLGETIDSIDAMAILKL